MNNVIYSSKVKKSLKSLAFILYNKNYFSFEENATQYVIDLVYFISEKINYTPKRRAISKTKYYNKDQYFITYKANKQTTWYIYFVEKNGKYIITHIDNNHVNPRVRSLKR